MKTRAASSTDLAIGPMVSCTLTSGLQPARLIRPGVDRTPTRLQKEDGNRTDPPQSVPRPTVAYPAAIAAPVPLLEPPGSRSRS